MKGSPVIQHVLQRPGSAPQLSDSELVTLALYQEPTWLASVHESSPPELASFAHGVQEDKAAVQAGLTPQMNNG